MNKTAVLFAALAVVLSSSLHGETLKEINEQLTKVGSSMMELHGELSDEAEALEIEFESGKHDTPEMKELRAKSDKLRQELIVVEKDLRGKFNALPQFAERMAKFHARQANSSKLLAERNARMGKRKEIFMAMAAEKPAAAEKTPAPAPEAPVAKSADGAAEKPAAK